MPCERLLSFLDERQVSYELIHHRLDYTAQETAADTHTPGRDFAKTVMLDMPGGHAMVVLPALYKVDLERVRQGLGTRQVRLSDEETMRALCPDCDVGAEPPFGNLYDIPVYVDPSLTSDEYITFNAGTHEDAVRMRYGDYERLVAPTIIDVSSAG